MTIEQDFTHSLIPGIAPFTQPVLVGPQYSPSAETITAYVKVPDMQAGGPGGIRITGNLDQAIKCIDLLETIWNDLTDGQKFHYTGQTSFGSTPEILMAHVQLVRGYLESLKTRDAFLTAALQVAMQQAQL